MKRRTRQREEDMVVFIPPQGEENESPVGQYFALCLAEGSLLTSNIKKRCGRSKLTENDE
jgi:hypothetical protein